VRLFYTNCLLIISLLVSPTSLLADQPLELKFTDAFKNSDAPLTQAVAASERIRDLQNLLDELFILEEKIVVIFGADDGPLFDPELSEIWMPESFINDIENRFDDAYELSGEVESLRVVEDVIQHTLIHEMAHALVAQFGLPILGREEDAADALGSVLLIEYLQGGQQVALTAADMFALESEDRPELDEADFWAEHSLDLQRYYSTLCHVYGSQPDAFEELLSQDGLGEERASQCEYEYNKLVEDWLGVLDPYLAE